MEVHEKIDANKVYQPPLVAWNTLFIYIWHNISYFYY